MASTRAAAARDRLDKLTARIDGKTVELRTANAELAAEHARLERSMLADDRHVPERRGFLGAYVALQALRADPEEGEAVTWFYHMTMSGLMVFELAFLLMKVVFAHASVYTVRLRARTQHEAAQVSIEYADNVADLRGQRHRPSWRLVNGADQPDESESRASKGRDSYQ